LGGLAPDAAKGEGDLIAKLAATPKAALAWANLAQALGVRARRGRSVNLDAAALLLDMLLAIEAEARSIGVTGQRA
jgi:DNA polymerase-3 subunit delta'